MSKKEQPDKGSPVWEEESAYQAVCRLEHVILDRLAGKLLTLLDATIADERQLKATKDMAKEIIYGSANDFLNYVQNALWGCQQKGKPMLPEWIQKRLDKEFK